MLLNTEADEALWHSPFKLFK